MVEVQDPRAGQQRPIQRYPQGYSPQPQQPQPRAPIQRPVQNPQPVQVTPDQMFDVPEKVPWHLFDKRMIIPLVVLILLILAAIVGRHFLMSADEQIEEAYAPSPAPFVPEPESVVPVETVPAIDEDIEHCNVMHRRGEFIEGDACFLQLSKDRAHVKICEHITIQRGPVSLDACYEHYAINSYDQSYCELMDTYDGENSYSSCMVKLANASDNIYLCQSVMSDLEPYSRIDCFSQFGLTEEQFNKEYLFQ